MGGYLIKPIRRADLFQAISIALGRTKAAIDPHVDPASPEPSAPAGRALDILLVEDSPDNRLLIRSYLKHTAHRLDVAEHGAIAVDRFTRGRYDLILMDMHMPVMDGYAATKAIRAWERDHAMPPTPIVALTAFALKEEAARIFEAGCNQHITKPVTKTTLLDVLCAYSAPAA